MHSPSHPSSGAYLKHCQSRVLPELKDIELEVLLLLRSTLRAQIAPELLQTGNYVPHVPLMIMMMELKF